MTIDDAVSWLQAAAQACRFYVSNHYVGIALVALDAAQWGSPTSRLALARAYELQAIRHIRRVSLWPTSFGRLEARVLGFCAAVLRATVEEEPAEPNEAERLRARVAELEAGLREVVNEFRDALPYVPTYFCEKWGYDGAIEKAQKLGEEGRS